MLIDSRQSFDQLPENQPLYLLDQLLIALHDYFYYFNLFYYYWSLLFATLVFILTVFGADFLSLRCGERRGEGMKKRMVQAGIDLSESILHPSDAHKPYIFGAGKGVLFLSIQLHVFVWRWRCSDCLFIHLTCDVWEEKAVQDSLAF